MQMTEKYRPRKLQDMVGQSQAINAICNLHDSSGLKGQVLWVTGESATGKTTLVRIIARIVADPINTTEIDALDVNLDLVREWERMCEYRPLIGDGYAFIVNEAHGLSSKVVSRLQTVLEKPCVQKNSTWLFTTTNRGHQRLFDSSFDSEPFLSRAVPVALVDDEHRRRACAARLTEIVKAELPDTYFTAADALALLEDCRGNMRSAIHRIASGDLVPHPVA